MVIALVGRKALSPSSDDDAAPASLNPSEQARLEQLIPEAQTALVSLMARLRQLGIQTYVGSTRRNPAEQAAIVQRGNSATQHSWHLLGRAVDLYPRLPNGQPDLNGSQLDAFRTMHAESKAFGWSGLAFNADGSKRLITTTKGGKQAKVWDGGHLQFTDGMTWAQAASKAGVQVA